MKIFAILTTAALAAAALLFAVPQASPLRAMLFAAQDARQPKKDAGAADAKKPPADPKKPVSAEEAAAREQTAKFAAFLLQRCRATLRDDKLSTYQADIEEQVQIGGRTFVATGKYWKGTDRLWDAQNAQGRKIEERTPRFRLELNMAIGEGKDAVKARMLQVCDGEVLMTEQVMGKKKRITRRNVREILLAAANAMQGSNAVPMEQTELVAEFGLGGINGLIASLQRSMVFDTRKTIAMNSRQAIQIEGGWNRDYTNHWINWMRQTRQGVLPAHIPDRVRVLVDSDDYLRKIEYLRSTGDGKISPLVSLSFHNIKLKYSIDEKKLFQYVPEPGVYVEDTTKSYIQMFQPPPAAKK